MKRKYLFKNILKNYDYNKLSKKEKITLLLKKQILLYYKDVDYFNSGSDFQNEFNGFNEDTKLLYVFNKKIHEEIYHSFYQDVEKHLNFQIPKNLIKIKIKHIVNEDEKIKILNKHIKKLSKKLENIRFYQIYNFTESEFTKFKIKNLQHILQKGTTPEIIINYINGEPINWKNDDLSSYSTLFDIIEVENEINSCIETIKEIKRIKSSKTGELTLNQKIILLDKIRNLDSVKWENTDIIKKARLISKLTGNSSENIRKKLPNLEKSHKQLNIGFVNDITFIDELIFRLLG